MWTSTSNDGQRLALLEEQVRHLERRLARYEPPAPPVQADWLNGPGRSLSPAEIDRETERLLAVCAEKGVEAVLPEVARCRELLVSLAEACHRSGLTRAGQYLDYLETPYD
jgi:hypothetical protein